MSKQTDQEKQPSENLTSEEFRQSILAELEASKLNLVELSDEQLMEIAGGGIDYPAAAAGVAVCCTMGALGGLITSAATGNTEQSGRYAAVGAGAAAAALVGSVGGIAAAKGVKKLRERFGTSAGQGAAPGVPHGNVELGPHHG